MSRFKSFRHGLITFRQVYSMVPNTVVPNKWTHTQVYSMVQPNIVLKNSNSLKPNGAEEEDERDLSGPNNHQKELLTLVILSILV